MQVDKKMRVLFFEENGSWVAVSLEHEILVQAASYIQAKRNFEKAIRAYVAVCGDLGLEPFENLPPAPARYLDMYEDAELALLATLAPPPELALSFEARRYT
jgi:hypothetical protein